MNPFFGVQFMNQGVQDQFSNMIMGGGGGQGFLGKAGNFMSSNADPIGMGISGLMGLSSAIFGGAGIDRDELGNRMTTDVYGQPVYSFQNYQSSIDEIKDRSKGEIGSSIISGASSGAQLGTAIAPGIGTAIGAGVGAIGGLFGGKRRKNKMKEEIRRRKNMLGESVTKFNEDSSDFYEDQMATDVRNFLLAKRAMRIAS